MDSPISFRPKLVDALKDYSAQKFYADAMAGFTVGIVALPLSMALAIASGLKPEIGIFTAIIGGLLVSLLGGSRVQIGGPAGAFVPLLAPIVMKHGPEALVVCAMMAGVILIVLGASKLGTLIKYIPYPVVTGFTSGIAIIIISTQIRDFFGLQNKLPPDFIGKLRALAENFQPNWPTVFLAMICTLAIWFWPKKIGRQNSRLDCHCRSRGGGFGVFSFQRKIWNPNARHGVRRNAAQFADAALAVAFV